MRQQVIGFCKFLYDIANLVVWMLGFFLLVVLVTYSIVYLKGALTSNPKIVLESLVSDPTLAWIWISSFVIMLVGFPVKIYFGIKRGLAQAKDLKLDTEQKLKKLFWWMMKD